MNNQEFQEPFRPRCELKRRGYEPNGHCYCGCEDVTGGFFAPGHDARIPRKLNELEQESTHRVLAFHTLAMKNTIRGLINTAGQPQNEPAEAADAFRQAADALRRAAEAMERAANAYAPGAE